MSIESVQVAAIVRRIQNPPMFTQHEYLERPWRPVCDLCGHSEVATQIVLERHGWFLGRTEICPDCVNAKV